MRFCTRTMGLLLLAMLSGACDAPAPTTQPATKPTTAPATAPTSSVPADWQTLRAADVFTFRAPPDLKQIPVQGIDSLVGQYESPGMKLTFDYGFYSDPMDRPGLTSESITVDGKSARLIHGDGVVAIHFPEVKSKSRLTMSVQLTGATPATAETLLKSIDFP